MNEPLWRKVLCWGAVITFLTVPLTVFILGIWDRELSEHIKGFKFLVAFFQAVTALVLGLAGLDTFKKGK